MAKEPDNRDRFIDDIPIEANPPVDAPTTPEGEAEIELKREEEIERASEDPNNQELEPTQDRWADSPMTRVDDE